MWSRSLNNGRICVIIHEVRVSVWGHLATGRSPAPHVVLPVTPDKKEVRRGSTQLNDALVTGRLLLGTVATVASGSVVIGSGVI